MTKSQRKTQGQRQGVLASLRTISLSVTDTPVLRVATRPTTTLLTMHRQKQGTTVPDIYSPLLVFPLDTKDVRIYLSRLAFAQ